MATKIKRLGKGHARAPPSKAAKVPPMRLRPDFGPSRHARRVESAPVELEAKAMPELSPAGHQKLSSRQQQVEGTTFQIACRRHGNLIAWAWTPGDPRQQADLQNLFKLLAPHIRGSWWGGCVMEFTTKAIKNV